MVIRWSIASVFALAATLGVFIGMQWVIQSSDRLDVETSSRKIIDFVQVKTQQQLIKNERKKPEKPPEPQSSPMEQLVPDFQAGDIQISTGQLDLGSVDLGSTIDIAGGVALGPVEDDAEYLPIAKIQPQYPPAAAKRGIEGYVVVEYTVTITGSTKDWKVVDAKPANVFERAALGAAKRFKYNPKVVDGKAVEVSGVRNRFNFKLQK